jgi:hypothetical protein
MNNEIKFSELKIGQKFVFFNCLSAYEKNHNSPLVKVSKLRYSVSSERNINRYRVTENTLVIPL